ncbi:1,4-dihydroxy-2-naphthoate octaprenyltransferase, partial [Mycobacterium tuberculosis]|nr:1,4-dihydroxy-2-naphthoate octaprenyltransferase [Mycobacterium tuberculosis]
LAIGAACIVAAWFYTGGKRPYGYNALGEVFVFIFFGLVATLGTTWVQVFELPQQAWLGAIAAGLFACAVLLANNLRDIDQDR